VSLSSHVLDAVRGRPARGLRIRWERQHAGQWEPVAEAVTDEDGRVGDWGGHVPTTEGLHRLVFDSGGYFAGQGSKTFYPEVVVVFEVVDADAHHHVPLLLSPYAYSTYRGS
jgi:5-hydroxyisourate hydrolase